MNNLQYLLMKLDEECKEVGICSSKIMQFGLNSDNNGENVLNNKESLFLELNDVLAVIQLLNEECQLGFTPDQDAIERKKLKLKKFRTISKNMGLVDMY